jgi:oxalate decarboxylase
LAVVAAFVAGSAVGSALLDGPTGPRPRRTLGAAAGALALAAGLAALDRALPGLLAAAAAMGMQNALHQVVAGADIGRGFLSGNLFALGQALARLGRGAGPRRAAAQNALSWLTFVAGAAAGAVALAVVGLAVALGIAATAAAAALVGLGPTRPPQNAQLSRSDSP